MSLHFSRRAGVVAVAALIAATLGGGEDGLFTKPAVADYPDYLEAACAGDPNGSCTTVHYKSAHPGAHRVARLRHRGQLR
jgi:hypothetical protein